MTRYRCPICRDLPVRLRLSPGRRPLCARCGGPLRRARSLGAGHLVAVAVTGLLLGIAAMPDLLGGVSSLAMAPARLPRLLSNFETLPDPAHRPLALEAKGLYLRLAEGDRRWLPTAEHLADGSIRYVYRRRPGDPELSVPELQALMADPPSREEELRAIGHLLRTLQKARVRLVLEEPRKSGAAAEWDPAARTMRIQPGVLEKGSVDFAQVLNHEAIHVAQSCAAGGLRARPRALGLSQMLDPELESHLAEPIYAGASTWETALEREAYANQHRLELGATLVTSHCRLEGL
jgi:hypothetical protein